jgi:hypothetical protein
MQPVFLSFDVEATGPAPGAYSCIQIGVRVCLYADDPSDQPGKLDWQKEGISVCLKEAKDGARSASTMKFWADNQATYDRICAESVDPAVGMNTLHSWLEQVYAKYEVREWVAWPSSFDWQFFNSYYHRYVDAAKTLTSLPYMATCMSGMLKTLTLLGHSKEAVLGYMKTTLPHTHYALDDADEQAYQYLRLLKYIRAHAAQSVGSVEI